MDIESRQLSDLKHAEYNPRKRLTPSDAEYQKIRRSITEFGYVDPIIINADGTIIGGHQRANVMMDLGYTTVDVVVLDISKEQEKALNVALNKISGEWDMEKLGALLEDLNNSMYDLAITGFDSSEIEDIMTSAIHESEDVDDDFNIDAELEEVEAPQTFPGDVYILDGVHRVMCGDAMSLDDIKILMDGKEAALYVTDPPYNVDYEGKAGKIANDKQSDVQFSEFLSTVFVNMYAVCKPGAAAYVFHADTNGLAFRSAFQNAGFDLKQCLVWVKNTFVLGRQDYQWQHEPILYGWKGGAAHYFTDDRTKTTVIFNDKPNRNAEHPTMKPVSLCGTLINNSSEANWIVADFFGGSGSTLIACAELRRVCYMMEISPKFCDVIIKRYIKWRTSKGKTSDIVLMRCGEIIPCPLCGETDNKAHGA